MRELKTYIKLSNVTNESRPLHNGDFRIFETI